jgi:hypothetical protein
MPVISTDIHFKEFPNVRFYPRQRYGPWPHRCEPALRDLAKTTFRCFLLYSEVDGRQDAFVIGHMSQTGTVFNLPLEDCIQLECTLHGQGVRDPKGAPNGYP